MSAPGRPGSVAVQVVIWAFCLLLVVFWTGGAVLLTQLTLWGARQLASGDAVALGESVVRWPVPEWLSVWIDAAWIQTAQDALAWVFQALQGALPMLGSAVGWIAPLIWVLWGLGVVLAVVLAGGVHMLLVRLRTASSRGA